MRKNNGYEDEGLLLVRSAYRVLDLFAGSVPEFLVWTGGLQPGDETKQLPPPNFNRDSRSLLVEYLKEVGVVASSGFDAFRLREFQRVAALLPYFREEEARRLPVVRSNVVFTVPPDVQLPPQARHLQRSLAARVSEALVSAEGRVLLASPYWSDDGRRNLLPSLQRAISGAMSVTLAGAKRDDQSHHAAMVAFGADLRAKGCLVRVLTFVPLRPHSIFHAKLVCGRFGYLGSANLTGSGLADHVEAGVPLNQKDVERVWWLIQQLEAVGLLTEEPVRVVS